MKKLKDLAISFLVELGVFLIGILAGMGGLLLLFYKKSPPNKEKIEEKLREKSPDDIVDMLDNSDAVRAIITGHGVRPDNDEPTPGTPELHDSSRWTNRNIFRRGSVDRDEPDNVGGSG